MTVPTTTPSEPGFYRVLERLHGHRCPMSILGARLGEAAMTWLAPPHDHRLEARYHRRTCALDGIQLATGCTLGNGHLEIVPDGQHRLDLGLEDHPERISVELTEFALERGRDYGALRECTDPHSLAEKTRILDDLTTAPTRDLVRRIGGA